ncbi:multidrug resistance protein 1B [Aspergillus udagawae]|nr:multidrug resistance protein 1B [Aspergillus udagawae]GFG24410.1 multidrug resistance protein 1B [Aspergillus udagawae]
MKVVVVVGIGLFQDHTSGRHSERIEPVAVRLLDEATAALDARSEAMVQEMLNKASKKRTTIAVAHQLSTIQHADVICVVEAGRLVEIGNHEELMRKDGVYAGLVETQNRGVAPEQVLFSMMVYLF